MTGVSQVETQRMYQSRVQLSEEKLVSRHPTGSSWLLKDECLEAFIYLQTSKFFSSRTGRRERRQGCYSLGCMHRMCSLTVDFRMRKTGARMSLKKRCV